MPKKDQFDGKTTGNALPPASIIAKKHASFIVLRIMCWQQEMGILMTHYC